MFRQITVRASLRRQFERRRYVTAGSVLPIHRGFYKYFQSTALAPSLSTTSPLRRGQHEVSEFSAYPTRCLSSALPNQAEDEIHNDVIPSSSERSVEEQYSRKTPLEHVLLRPGMYVGPTERLPPNQSWVLEPTPAPPNDNPSQPPPPAVSRKMTRREYGVVPALIKIFDEILVNASDNRLRHPKSCTRIDVTIDPGGENHFPWICVENDGRGIPIQIHRKENMYVAEMLFGHLLTGSNFDDKEKRVTGGRHGYGAKLTNIFSKHFAVETQNARKGLTYQQEWKDNMTSSSAPQIDKIEKSDNVRDYTRVSFVPDMARLSGIPTQVGMDHEDYAIMCRRVVDVAGCSAGKLHVTLNGVDVSVGSFEDYCLMYRDPEQAPLRYSKVNSRWEVAIGLSDNGSFDGISFVNGMATTRGGTHLNYIVQQVTKIICDKVAKLDPELSETVTAGLVRRNLFCSVNALIENPTFDSQMKESLTSGPNSWGSKCDLSKKYLQELVLPEEDGGPGIIEEVIRVARGRLQANLLKEVGGSKKTRRQLLSIPKLDDAHLAGSADGSDCTLILTEGDSAKALAVAGLEVIGRDKFGVFPLRGKFLNVRQASVDQLTKNAEVKALCSILGLDFDKEYDSHEERAELRYGHVMLMTDQDTDGSHIKGLVMNFFRHFWPKLLKPAVDQPLDQPFLSAFVTPLLKAKRKGRKETLSFYSMAEYNEWKSSLQDDADLKQWSIKYYKGLGTSTLAEAKEYFKAFSSHVRPFHWNSEIDGELLDMVFDKERASDRRSWILDEYNPESMVSHDPDRGNAVSYEDFVNNEMIHFSNADNIRSLPSVIDGLKPSQRKVLYACFKRKLKSEVKVAQLTGYCAEHTAYHHGEASLQATIIGMAQDFVGSNNINLLVPSGQFGTRLSGGKDAASPRYIFTHLSPLARYLFPEADDILLNYKDDDGQLIEPEFYCPIIPMLVCNGSQGIGTGWSTFLPPHNPTDVLEYARGKLNSAEELPALRPWARGFVGDIRLKDDGKGYVSIGKAEMITDRTLRISELPLGKWTEDYKNYLLKMRNKGDIQTFVEDHTTSSVSFTVTTKAVQLARMMKSGLDKVFKLRLNLSTTNMNAFDENNVIQKYSSAEDIVDAYFPTRLSMYHDRKSVQESEMSYTAALLKNKARFIDAVSEQKIDLIGSKRKTKEEMIAVLQQLHFMDSRQLKSIRDDNVVALRNRAADEAEAVRKVDYDYLLNMPLSSLTSDKIQELHRDTDKKEAELETLRETTAEDLWRSDLDKLEEHL